MEKVLHSGMAETVTAATLARYFGVTARAIGDLVKRKVITAVTFPTVRSRRVHAPRHDALPQPRARSRRRGRGRQRGASTRRLDRAQAELVETKGRKLRGELVDAAEVEAEWSGVLRPRLSAHDVTEIDAEVREALTAVGGSHGLSRMDTDRY